jgi:hypothetical protein
MGSGQGKSWEKRIRTPNCPSTLPSHSLAWLNSQCPEKVPLHRRAIGKFHPHCIMVPIAPGLCGNCSVPGWPEKCKLPLTEPVQCVCYSPVGRQKRSTYIISLLGKPSIGELATKDRRCWETKQRGKKNLGSQKVQFIWDLLTETGHKWHQGRWISVPWSRRKRFLC